MSNHTHLQSINGAIYHSHLFSDARPDSKLNKSSNITFNFPLNQAFAISSYLGMEAA